MFCSNCSKRGCTSRCAKCKNAYYCTRACQVAHWKQHKKSCNKTCNNNVSTIKIVNYKTLPNIPYDTNGTRDCCAQLCGEDCILIIPSSDYKFYLYDIKTQAYSIICRKDTDLGFGPFNNQNRPNHTIYTPYYSFFDHILISFDYTSKDNNTVSNKHKLILSGCIIVPNIPPKSRRDFVWQSIFSIIDTAELKLDDIKCIRMRVPESIENNNDAKLREDEEKTQEKEEIRVKSLIGSRYVDLHRGARATMYENWMIVTTTNFDESDNIVSIYEIDPNDNYPRFKNTLSLNEYITESVSFKHHGCIILPRLGKREMHARMNQPNDPDMIGSIDILMFGGSGVPFAEPFFQFPLQ